MKNLFKINLGTLIVLVPITYAVYYLLLHDNFLNTSIAAIIASSHHLAIKKHLLVLGLLPIYIAAMIFGAGLLGIYLGNALQQLLIRTNKTPSLVKKYHLEKFAKTCVRKNL